MVLTAFALDEVASGADGGPDVGEAGGERGQAEPEPVRGAVIRDDVPGGELPDDLLGLRMAVADVAAAAATISRRGQRAAKRLEPGAAQVDEVAGQPQALGADGAEARLEQQPRAFFHRGGAHDRRGARHELADAGRRVVPGPHGELVALREPAPYRLP